MFLLKRLGEVLVEMSLCSIENQIGNQDVLKRLDGFAACMLIDVANIEILEVVCVAG